MSSFKAKLEKAWSENNSMVCVGLDPDLAKMPQSIKDHQAPIFEFNRAIVDECAEHVCAFKPQLAYYNAQNAEDQLIQTIEHIHQKHPNIPVILDAKRGDIGSTAEQYAKEVFERYKADAVTVNPYMGMDTLEPFFKYEGKGVIVLCRTSNPGAGDFQDLLVDGKPLYQNVAKSLMQKFGPKSSFPAELLMVVGATFPEQLKEVRAIVGEQALLIPGIGAQGGSIEDVLNGGRNQAGQGLIISSSRSIIYASSGEDFASAAGSAAKALKEQVRNFSA